MVFLTVMPAVSTAVTVPSTQLATYAVLPVGESATAVGSEPTATVPFTAGVEDSPEMRTSFCSSRSTTNAVSLSGEIATCQGSFPTGTRPSS